MTTATNNIADAAGSEKRISISRRFHFSASHRYWIDAWTQERNNAEFGKTTSPFGHGHNYILEVHITGNPDPVTGMIVNLTEVKAWVNEVLKRYDHKYLNVDHPAFAQRNPTTENIALVLWEEIAACLPDSIALYKIVLWENEDLFAQVEAV